MKVKAFLSYSSVDKTQASIIKWNLERFGFEAFLAHQDIEPSYEWQEIILSQLKVCDVFIPILTSDFGMSAWTDQEAGFALARDIIIIPLDAGVKPYGFIGKYQALPLKTAYVVDSCFDIAKIVSAKNPIFADAILEGTIQTFGKSNTFDEASQSSSCLSKLKHLLTAEHMNRILRLAASNNQIHNSYGARGTLEVLIENFKGQLKPSLIRKYRDKIKD